LALVAFFITLIAFDYADLATQNTPLSYSNYSGLQRTLHLIFFQYDILLAYQAFQILGSQHDLKRFTTDL